MVAKSPRMVPGSASSTLVAPTIVRTSEKVLSAGPSTTIANTGERVRKLDQLAEERLVGVLGVVLLGERLVDRAQLGGDEA